MVIQAYYPKSVTAEDDLDDLMALINNAVEDSKFYPYRSDRFARIALAGAKEDESILQADDYWSAKAQIWATMACLFSDPATEWSPALGDLTALTPGGTIPAPLDLLEVTGTYSGGSHLTTLGLKVWDNTGAVLQDSVTISDRLLSDEELSLDYRGIIRQVYEDDFSSGTRFGQDAVNDGGSVSGGVLTLGNENSCYYWLKGPWPLRKNIVVSADIVISAGTPVLQYSFDGVNWTTAYSGTELTETDTWTIPNTAGRTDVYIRFKSQSSNFAELTTACTGNNNDLKFTARKSGVDGNSVRVAYLNPGGTGALSISVSGNDISVTVRRTSGTINSTALEIMDAMWSDLNVLSLLGNIAPASGNDGTGVVTAFALTNLSGGTVTASMTIDNLRIEQERQIPESELPVIPLGGSTYKVEIDNAAGSGTVACSYRDRFWI